jgi:hypothetical protein
VHVESFSSPGTSSLRRGCVVGIITIVFELIWELKIMKAVRQVSIAYIYIVIFTGRRGTDCKLASRVMYRKRWTETRRVNGT